MPRYNIRCIQVKLLFFAYSIPSGLSLFVFVLTEAADWSHPLLHPAHQIYVFISHTGRFGRIVYLFSMTEAQFHWEALFYVHVFVSQGRQLCSLLYPVRQLHHVCSVDADDDQDYKKFWVGKGMNFIYCFSHGYSKNSILSVINSIASTENSSSISLL